MKDFLDLISAGQYLPAVGLALIAIVGALRAGVGVYVPWLRTKAGGYVLGFGSAVLLYVGTSLQAGMGVSLGLFMSALAAGWVAAGGWEHARDLIDFLRGKPDDANALPTATVVSRAGAAAIVALLALSPGCGPKTIAAEHQFISCAESAATKDLAPTVESVLTNGAANWEAQLEALGKAFGIDAINCAVSAVKAQLQAHVGDALHDSAVARAAEWLEKHGGA